MIRSNILDMERVSDYRLDESLVVPFFRTRATLILRLDETLLAKRKSCTRPAFACVA